MSSPLLNIVQRTAVNSVNYISKASTIDMKLREYPQKFIRIAQRTVTQVLKERPMLNEASGIIHVGASHGQERELYKSHNLKVIWIEPIPSVFQRLEENIREYPFQKAYQYLITDKDGENYQFNISNNSGQSSSIYELNLHKDIWPGISYTQTITLPSLTLSSFIKKESIDMSEFDILSIDTQGSELLVLKGGKELLRNFKYIKTEAADFESYTGCCKLSEIDSFLQPEGFREYSRYKFKSQPKVGNYYDLIYKRVD